MMSTRGKIGHRKDSADSDSEGEPIAEKPRRVRQKGLPRYAPSLNPGPGIDLDYAPFSTADVDALIRTVGYPLVKGLAADESVAVKEALNLHARTYRLRVELDRQPTLSTVIKEMKSLEQRARDLEAGLPLLKASGDPEGLEFAAAPAQGLLWILRRHLPEAMADRVEQLRKQTARTIQRRGIPKQEEDLSLTEETLFGANTAEDLLTVLSEGAGVLATACSAAVREAEQRSQPGGGPAETATALKKTVLDLLQLYAAFFGRKATIWKEGVFSRPSGPTLRFVQGALQVLGVETSDDNLLRIYQLEGKSLKSGDGSGG